MQKNKTVFIIISKEVIRRNILDTGFWNEYRDANPDTKTVIIVSPGLKADYEAKFGGPNVEIRETQKEPVGFWYKLVLFMVRTGIDSHGTTLYRWRSYTMGQANLVMTIIKTMIANTFARWSWYHRLVRRLFRNLSLNWVTALFDEFKPDLVFAPSLIDINIDAPIAREAGKRDIRVVGMVRSWDNLLIHGLLPYVPDRFLLQNKWLEYCALKFQSIDTEKLEKDIVGLPHYDLYKNPGKYIKSREDFFKGMGLDPSKRLVVLGGFDFYFSEDLLPAKLDKAIEEGKFEKDIQIIFRPHPKTPFEISDYNTDKLKNVVLNAAFLDKKKAFSDTETFINLLYHCDVMVTMASTLHIDAAVFGKPSIAVDFDEPGRKIPRWKSVHRLYDTFDHFEALIATNGVKKPTNFEDLVNAINSYLDDPDQDIEGRKRLIDLLVAPYDGKSAIRLASILNEEIKKLDS